MVVKLQCKTKSICLLTKTIFDCFRVQKALSFSVALFASVCLASRLSTSFHTYSLVTSAVLVFALWPELRKYIKVFYFENKNIFVEN